MGIPGSLAPCSPGAQSAGREKDLPLPLPVPIAGRDGGAWLGVGEALARAAGERGGGRCTPPPCSLCVLLPLASVRGRADHLRVLGGRGAVEDEDDLPELSDSGDEAAWEDEDDAEPPHDKQQTPCLFCDRFVLLRARRHP